MGRRATDELKGTTATPQPGSVSAAYRYKREAPVKLALVLVAMLVAGCGFATATPDPRTVQVGCSLRQDHGNLVAQNGEAVLQPLGDWGAGAAIVTPDWPEGWTIAGPADDGQLGVLDSDGSLVVRTGTHIIVYTSDYLNEFNRDGEYIVCGANSYGPITER